MGRVTTAQIDLGPSCCLLGRITWAIPATLGRILPRLNVEGTDTDEKPAPELVLVGDTAT